MDELRGAGARLFSATVASERAYELAEGPVWDEERARVLWVDINPGQVHIGSLHEDVVEDTVVLRFDQMVGAAVCSADGRLLVAGQRDLYLVEPEARRRHLCALVPAEKNSRLNDGACDPAGRFLVGSMALDARQGEECLYRLGSDGTPATLDSDLTLSNGLAWSPDGSVLYTVDTTPGIVWSRPYDVTTGATGARSQILHFGKASPDGMCVDTDGNLWVAVWGAGEVRCFTPAGERVATVTVPAPLTTSVAFVGQARDTLLITTARDQLSSAQVDAFPLSGHHFIAHVNATGVPTTPWAGP
jgi:sugar lactone lactonase YvrE